jgi:purine-binding chemotaxis protein CheW
MSLNDKSGRLVVDQKDALSLYFDALLREQNDEPLASRPAAEPLLNVPPVLSPPVISVPVIPEIETVTTDNKVTTLATENSGESEQTQISKLVEGPPEWAAEPFQALLFKVSGLTLAVPLIELSGVQEWHDSAVTPMLGRIAWYLGLMGYRGHQVPVVDTAQLVLPPDRLANLIATDRGRLGHVVFIEDGQWGLACDSVEDVISLNLDEVKWRSSRSKRRWLAGTVLEHMCAIIDPPAFADMLRTGMTDRYDELIDENETEN